jgi:hypothetical protein
MSLIRVLNKQNGDATLDLRGEGRKLVYYIHRKLR